MYSQSSKWIRECRIQTFQGGVYDTDVCAWAVLRRCRWELPAKSIPIQIVKRPTKSWVLWLEQFVVWCSMSSLLYALFFVGNDSCSMYKYINPNEPAVLWHAFGVFLSWWCESASSHSTASDIFTPTTKECMKTHMLCWKMSPSVPLMTRPLRFDALPIYDYCSYYSFLETSDIFHGTNLQ